MAAFTKGVSGLLASFAKEIFGRVTTDKKWTREDKQPGILIFLKEENLHSLQWAIGRVIEVQNRMK